MTAAMSQPRSGTMRVAYLLAYLAILAFVTRVIYVTRSSKYEMEPAAAVAPASVAPAAVMPASVTSVDPAQKSERTTVEQAPVTVLAAIESRLSGVLEIDGSGAICIASRNYNANQDWLVIGQKERGNVRIEQRLTGKSVSVLKEEIPKPAQEIVIKHVIVQFGDPKTYRSNSIGEIKQIWELIRLDNHFFVIRLFGDNLALAVDNGKLCLMPPDNSAVSQQWLIRPVQYEAN